MTRLADNVVHAKVLPWGGSVGIRISRAEADRLGLKPGQEIEFKVISPGDQGVDLSRIRTFRDGIQTAGLKLAAGDAASHDLERRP